MTVDVRKALRPKRQTRRYSWPEGTVFQEGPPALAGFDQALVEQSIIDNFGVPESGIGTFVTTRSTGDVLSIANIRRAVESLERNVNDFEVRGTGGSSGGSGSGGEGGGGGSPRTVFNGLNTFVDLGDT